MTACAIRATTPDLASANRDIARLSAPERIRWALANLPAPYVLTSSFGAQSAVMLHLVTRELPDIPVVLVDTGYLFPETYRFIDELVDRLGLDLRVYRASQSPAWQEARYGRLWERGQEGIDEYNRINKVEPLRRAFDDLRAATWFAGLRREQSSTRADLDWLSWKPCRYKMLPILEWTDRDVYQYLRQYDLPYHPLWHEGYVSIGDWHTTRSLADSDNPETLRFFGLKRECGIHEEV